MARQFVRYDRYESAAALVQIRRVYELLRVYANLYQPVMKLIGKEWVGSRVRKRYDEARTPRGEPSRRGVIAGVKRAELEQLMGENGPLSLKRRVDAEMEKLWKWSLPTSSALHLSP